MNLRCYDNLSSVQFNKKVLGKQKYCYNGSVRYWVWEFDNYRVYVSKEGVSFEVLNSLSLEEAWLAWQDYYNKIIKF